jgi:hypothetical protein
MTAPEAALARLAGWVARSGAPLESTIAGPSMLPTLPPGAQVRIEAAPWGPGDVIAFAAGRGLVAHRVVGQGRGARARAWVVTRGDARVLCDPPGRVAHVAGRVAAWRAPGSAAWEPVPPAPARTGVRGWAARTFARVLLAALEWHVWAARAVYVSCWWLEGGPQPRPGIVVDHPAGAERR